MGNTTEFDIKSLVDYIVTEYGVEKDTVMTIIEESITKAAKKNKNFTNDLKIVLDRNDYSIHVFDTLVVSDESSGVGVVNSIIGKRLNKGRPVKEGDLLTIEYPTKYLGRVCARESRMMILQNIKKAKNNNIISQYQDHIGDIVTGTITGIEKGNIIFTVNGKTEMVIPRKERILKERYVIGNTISGIITSINTKQRNSPITVSRSSNHYLEELLKQEIPELEDGTLEIVAVRRDPGRRAKVVIKSNNTNVDPVGSCVGKRGARIRSVVNELSGEKIDIIRYSDDINELVRETLSPARVDKVEQDPLDEDTINVTVAPDEYMKAIGKFGINVKLASSLLGYRINVKKAVSMLSFDEQKKYAINNLSEVLSIPYGTAEKIVNAGFLNPNSIVAEDEVSFISFTGLEDVEGKGIYAAAKAVVESGINLSCH